MNFNNIYIILARPEESRNIGAACRAMANNSIFNLRIVGKKQNYDAERVKILAIHASPIWQNAQFFDTITQATSDCSIVFGTTRRKGKKRRDKYYFPEELAIKAQDISSNNGKIAIVFGNERTGLTDEELNECTSAVTIPSSKEFASLNLSHAVQIICYHLFRQHQKTNEGILNSGFTPISMERLDKTVCNITDNLESIGFFKIAGKDEQSRFWKDILSRASLSEGESQYLEKIFSKASGLCSKKSN